MFTQLEFTPNFYIIQFICHTQQHKSADAKAGNKISVKLKPEVISTEVEVSRGHDIRCNVHTDQQNVEDEEFKNGEEMLKLWIRKASFYIIWNW